MVLWKRESTSADGPFVNLFANCSSQATLKDWKRKLASADWKSEVLFNQKISAGKNDQNSAYMRNMGNQFFDQQNWLQAMEMYSKSLCFAVPGSKTESLAYANRASCFLKLNRFDECLRDIDLAEKANYPNMPKLMARKAACERAMMMETEEIQLVEPKLSFQPHEKFPCMANVLDIHQNAEFGRHIVANSDIDVGKIIVIERSYITLGTAPDRVQCYTCTESDKNFIACPNCTDAMFCNEKCRDENVVHNKFCGGKLNRMPHDVKFLIESVLLAIVTFSTVDELMEFALDTILVDRGVQISTAANDLESKYHLFLNLLPKKFEKLDMELVHKAFTALMDNSTIKEMFNSLQSQRFLMHLVAEHSLIIANNAFEMCVVNGVVGQNLGLVRSLFNHSCAPNVYNVSSDVDVLITIRPIKKGEQLFVRYKLDDISTQLRQMILLQAFNFLCKCDKCEPHCSQGDRLAMRTHPDFQFLRAALQNQQCNGSNVEKKCVEFLRKFGHLPWSEEMGIVLKLYTKILNEKFI